MLSSPYLYASIALTAVCYPWWAHFEIPDGRKSSNAIVNIIPNLLAFSIGGMAILLAFSGERFLSAIRQQGKSDSLFMNVVVAFFHFIIVQILALICTFVSISYPSSTIVAGLAFELAAYSMLSALAASAALLNIAQIFNASIDIDDK